MPKSWLTGGLECLIPQSSIRWVQVSYVLGKVSLRPQAYGHAGPPLQGKEHPGTAHVFCEMQQCSAKLFKNNFEHLTSFDNINIDPSFYSLYYNVNIPVLVVLDVSKEEVAGCLSLNNLPSKWSLTCNSQLKACKVTIEIIRFVKCAKPEWVPKQSILDTKMKRQ